MLSQDQMAPNFQAYLDLQKCVLSVLMSMTIPCHAPLAHAAGRTPDTLPVGL